MKTQKKIKLPKNYVLTQTSPKEFELYYKDQILGYIDDESDEESLGFELQIVNPYNALGCETLQEAVDVIISDSCTDPQEFVIRKTSKKGKTKYLSEEEVLSIDDSLIKTTWTKNPFNSKRFPNITDARAELCNLQNTFNNKIFHVLRIELTLTAEEV